ncbi:g11492 [Coccomyxa viridis]|uniref:G11492 protein n=1 Tax=Coccomyxa viridis TaxID=1274662 RepID=A0ABP1G8E0_9CHLO
MKGKALGFPHSAGRVASCTKQPNFSSLLLDFTLVRLLGALSGPLRRVVALYVVLGRSLWTLVGQLVFKVADGVGWLSAPPRSPVLRSVGRGIITVRRWHYTIASILLYTAVCRAIQAIREASDATFQERKRLKRALEQASSYEEWSVAATKLDNVEGNSPEEKKARKRSEMRLYDRRLLEERLKHLREVRERGHISEMMFAVRADLLRNLGNMTNSELHEHFPTVPEPIREYIEEVQKHLEGVTAYDGPDMSLEDKLNFLRETRHAFGRTALVLSGGGALGAFHIGVVKALREQGLLPRVIAGSSVGSIVAACVGTRDDEELKELFDNAESFDLSFFSNNTVAEFVKHFISTGTLHDARVLQMRLKRLLGNATFLQAFQHSGRILNVAVCPADTNEPPRVLNYLTAPDVYVWSAVSCSSAFPLLFAPQDLKCRNADGEEVIFSAEPLQNGQRRWRDGSLEEDLPMRSLSEMFNVNYFLVSQTNPHIVPVLNLKKRVNRKLGNLLEAEWKHRCQQLMYVFPVLRWLKVFSQTWEGDVTMVLPSSFMQLKKSVTNPSNQDLLDACKQGERVTWAKLPAIQANCGIEMTLDECMLELSEMMAMRKQVAGLYRVARAHPQRPSPAAASKLRKRIPSWINLSAMGLPRPASDESLDGRGASDNSLAHTNSSKAMARAVSGTLDAVDEALPMESFSSAAFATHEPYSLPSEHMFRGTANEASLMDDCTDRSVNILATLRPLERASKRLSSVRRSPSNQGLDSVEY